MRRRRRRDRRPGGAGRHAVRTFGLRALLPRTLVLPQTLNLLCARDLPVGWASMLRQLLEAGKRVVVGWAPPPAYLL